MNERLCWTGSELHNGRGGGKDVIAVAASPAAATATAAAVATVAVVADCLSIGALFCQWVVQKCCSISMHNAADTLLAAAAAAAVATTRVAPAVLDSKWPQIAGAIANYAQHSNSQQLATCNLTLSAPHKRQRAVRIYIVIMLQLALISLAAKAPANSSCQKLLDRQRCSRTPATCCCSPCPLPLSTQFNSIYKSTTMFGQASIALRVPTAMEFVNVLLLLRCVVVVAVLLLPLVFLLMWLAFILALLN